MNINMGIWDWKDVKHKKIDLSNAPNSAKLAASIVPDQFIDENYEQSVFEKTQLPQLSLVEWSISDDVVPIFEILRAAGSHEGYVVEQASGFVAETFARKISLDGKTARQVADDVAMDMPMAFVDDQAICALASYHSDYALIAMRADLLDRFVTHHEFTPTLWADEEPYRRPANYKEAQALAKRRSDAWDRYLEESRKT